ncbi:MAG: sigma-70 family RNA polymerase sigma factor [Paucibacter sp.]|nr:sigma-70 family RNA polymerase sigma factor [Roseateles sp.]
MFGYTTRSGPSQRPGNSAGDSPSPGEAAELRLLQGVATGQSGDFEALYRLYHPRLFRFLGRMLRRQALIEEVLDDTLMLVWTRPLAFNGRSKVSTWIFGVAYRKALKALARLDEPLPDDPDRADVADDSNPEDTVGQRERRDLLHRALDQLSPEHRAVVALCYFYDMDYADIAAVVECPVATVKTRMFHARRKLRILLPELADEATSLRGECP